jgi:hypothetical protein
MPASATDPDSCATFRVLDTFRLLNVVGNINAQDFIGTLERLTDALGSTGLQKVPVRLAFYIPCCLINLRWLQDRYKAFLRMARLYAFLLRAKRAGRGHDPAGLEATKQGECAVICWTCPFDERNLPENWRDVEPKSA